MKWLAAGALSPQFVDWFHRQVASAPPIALASHCLSLLPKQSSDEGTIDSVVAEAGKVLSVGPKSASTPSEGGQSAVLSEHYATNKTMRPKLTQLSLKECANAEKRKDDMPSARGKNANDRGPNCVVSVRESVCAGCTRSTTPYLPYLRSRQDSCSIAGR